jgi:hypothetical protein
MCPIHPRFPFPIRLPNMIVFLNVLLVGRASICWTFGASVPSQLKSLSELAEEERVAKQKVIDDEAAALAAMASTSIQVCTEQSRHA